VNALQSKATGKDFHALLCCSTAADAALSAQRARPPGYASPAVTSVEAATGTVVVPPIVVTVDTVPLTLCR
jgi:hypothetical protein